MQTRYKIIISNKALYKEIELTPENQSVVIGTDIESDIRIRKECFFEPIKITFSNTDGKWNLFCSDNLYIDTGDVRQLVTKDMFHGDSCNIKYRESNQDAFELSFMVDFDYETKDYSCEIDISSAGSIKIGGVQDANVYVSSTLLTNDFIILQNKTSYLEIVSQQAKYGVMINGVRVDKNTVVNNYDFISICDLSFYYKNGKLYTSAYQPMVINGLNYQVVDFQSTHFKYPEFIRNNRIQYSIPEEEIEIKQPTPKPQKNKKNLLFSLIPSLVMLALMIVMRGILGGGGSFVIYSVCSMGIGVIMSIVTYFYDGKEHQKAVKQREIQYLEYVKGKEEEILNSRNNELRIRNLINESLSNSINEVFSFGKRLFEKSNRDKDFLEIYLGTGIVTSNVPVKFTKQDFIDAEDPISQIPEELEAKYRNISNAPIAVDFKSANGIGLVGNKKVLHSILKNITLDMAIRHFYNDVKMFYVFKDNDTDDIQWIKWLRHAYNEEIGVRNIMRDEESRRVLLENIYAILSERENAVKECEGITFDVHYIVFVMDSDSIRKHPVSKYIVDSEKLGFTFVFFEEYEEFLPAGCTEVIRLNETINSGSVIESINGDIITDFEYTEVSDELAETISLRLGAISVEEVSLESELTKSISMYEMLNIFSVDDLNLKERWETSQVFKSMAAPLGVKTKNETVYLDISDKANAHGPHGLVAGTTGSGKSEILQTYVLSMATLYHPYDVGFVIIDFKGGGMANQFKDLPHMMGAITNIDGREINRSLLSIKAELVKRQSYFAAAGVNHINDYIKLFKKGSVKDALPHLIIIVDEFAELKAEFPDFMKELISAARIGRTLGVHLILATQKPAGVVDSQIWSNSKFKLCLKVQTKEDSNEVIKTPLAAEIVEPGRAYFQVGNNEIFELFQSAYSGVKVSNDGDDKTKVFSIYSLNDWGKKSLVYTNKKKSQSDNAKNQLQVIVDYVGAYCKNAGIQALGGICLPSLDDIVKKNSLGEFAKTSQNIVVPVGIYDDPERQDQGNYCIDLSENNTYIIGSAMTGKTTLLQTMLLQLMNYYTPTEVNTYIIDCGNMTLKAFENSNIVGGVALTSEEDKVTNLFKLLFRIIDERKQIFSEKGLGTHRAYIEAGYKDMPQIVLIIDNLAAFKEYYDNLSDDFLALSREGNSLGISIVATATQTNAMNYKALSNYGTRISFVCNDTNEYMNLFDRCRMEPKDTAGRGLCVIDKRIMEFQTALCVDGDKEFIRVENIKKEIESCNSKYPNSKALPIPVVPEVIKFSSIKSEEALYRTSYKVPMGIQYSTVQYSMLDLTSIGLIATLGREKSGKTNFVKHIMASIQNNIFGSLTEAYVIDNPERTLNGVQQYGFVERYTVDITEIAEIIDKIEKKLVSRQENALNDTSFDLNEEPLLLLVIENSKLFEHMQTSKELSAKMITLLKQYKKYKFAVVLSELENTNVPFNAPDFMKFVKENKKFVFFDELAAVKFFDVTARQQKENAKPLKTGDAFLCINGEVERIKTILCEEGK